MKSCRLTAVAGMYLLIGKQWFSSFASLFKMGSSLKGKICFRRERILSFKCSSFWYGSHFYPSVTFLECYYFYYARAYLCNGCYANGAHICPCPESIARQHLTVWSALVITIWAKCFLSKYRDMNA